MMRRIIIIQLLILFCCYYIQIINSIPLTSTSIIIGNNKTVPDKQIILNDETKQINDKTIEELVQQQTDTIKKIVSNQQHHHQQSRLDYPVITKYNIDDKQKIKQDIDKLTLEELKIRCQHLARLANNKTNPETNNGNNKITTSKPFTTIKPELFLPYQQIKIGNKIQALHYTTQKPIGGFYITTKASTTSTTTTTTTKKPSPLEIVQQQTNKLPHNVKYIKLEPVILQKTILSDGRTIYYWHKSLPSAVQYASPSENSLPSINQERFDLIQTYNHHNNQPLAPSTTTTTTTTTKSPPNNNNNNSGYDFSNFFPSFYSIGKSESPTTTTTEKTTTTTSTTTTENPKTTTEEEEELQYTHQLRFVVPVPYANTADNMHVMKQHPWEFDQFAYYPKPLQPSTVNVQVPYIPTFHVIKALAVPNKYGNGKIDENYSGIDNVQV